MMSEEKKEFIGSVVACVAIWFITIAYVCLSVTVAKGLFDQPLWWIAIEISCYVYILIFAVVSSYFLLWDYVRPKRKGGEGE
jgi:hypothetical protein